MLATDSRLKGDTLYTSSIIVTPKAQESRFLCCNLDDIHSGATNPSVPKLCQMLLEKITDIARKVR